MIAFLLANVAIVQTPWLKIEDARSIFDLKDGGVGIRMKNGEVKISSAKGEIEETIACPNGFTAISYTKNAGLVVAPNQEFYSLEKGAILPQSAGILISHHGNLIRIGGGVQIASQIGYKVGRYAQSFWDRYSAYAVNRAGDMIAIFERPMNAGILKILKFSGRAWVEEDDPVTPEVESYGLAVIMPGYSDIRFVSERCVMFIGGLWTTGLDKGVIPKKVDMGTLPVKFLVPLTSSKARAQVYLFATDFRSRLTRPVMKVEVDVNPEISYAFGEHLSVSGDSEHLFLLGVSGVWRFKISELTAPLY